MTAKDSALAHHVLHCLFWLLLAARSPTIQLSVGAV